MERYDDLRKAIKEQVLVTAASGVQIADSEGGTKALWLFDFRALLMQPQWLDRYAEIFWEQFASKYPFQVCAMESAGISLVAAIVMKSVERGTPVNGFFIRKSRKRQGLMKQIEGVVTDEPVIMVDDLVNTGSTFGKMMKILEGQQKTVSAIFTLLAFRGQGAYRFVTSRGVDVRSVFSLTDFDIPLLSDHAPEIPRSLFETLWHFRAADPTYYIVVQKSAPALDEKRVYFGTDAGTFVALDQSDGSVVWTFATQKHPDGKGIFSSPALDETTVYFGAYDGNVYALDSRTGTLRWTYGEADWVGSSPSLAPDLGIVFIGLEFGLLRKRGGIAAIDTKTGSEKWSVRTPEYTHASPLYIQAEGAVAIGSNDGVAYCYEATSGRELWNYRTGGEIKTACAYDPKRRMVIFGSMDGTVYAFSAKDGTPIFAFETGAGIYSTPLVHEDTVYVTSLDKTVYAIDLNTGKKRASFDTNGRIFASPVFAEHSVWVGSNDGRLYELDPDTLQLHGSFQVTERIVSKIAYAPESKRFFVPTHANELYCITRATSALS